MKTLERFFHRLNGRFRGSRPDSELAEELEFHFSFARLSRCTQSIAVSRPRMCCSFILTLTGVAIGIASAWQLAHLMQGMLFGVEPRDPIVFLTVPIVLGAVALLAVWLPANRASRIQPLDALRHE